MKHLNTLILLFTACFVAAGANGQSAWPKTISFGDNGKLTMYEPQPESLDGNTLTGRAAVSVRKSPNDEPVFGSLLFTSKLNGQNSSPAAFETFEVTNAKFSNLENQSEVDDYMSLIEKEAPGWSVGSSTKELAEVVREQNDHEQSFNNSAPRILYNNAPATLIVLDGEPRILKDKELDADKVVNSPNLLFKEGSQWNLYAGGIWYKSASIKTGWKQNTNLSSKLKAVNEQIKKQEKENEKNTEAAAKPRVTQIIVATEPTELLQTDGEPVYKTVSGTSLLYVSNSPNEIFKDISSQDNYILIAGRWYRAQSVKGPWSYVASDKLPADFAKIPDGSEKSDVLSNVAGTDAAEEAKMDAEIPQTAKVDRRTASINVQYDGEPVFRRISGTSLSLAENANVTVMIDASGNYFALENGIWFISDDAGGPWAVANDRPRDIDDIPASSPAYNSKYVYVYDYTPDYVYTGYTSGYLGSYVYGPTIVYGTGYYYQPWFHNVYYPRPFTWGFGFAYDPWWGWNMNWGYNYGYLYVGYNYGRPNYYGYGYGGCGWFGPSGYYPGYRRPYWSGGYYGRRDYYGRAGARRDYYGANGRANNRQVYGANRAPRTVVNNNVYNNQNGVVTRTVNRSTRNYRPAIDRSNVTSSAGSNYRGRPSNRFSETPSVSRPEVNRPSGNTGTIAERRRNFDRPQSQTNGQVEGYRGSNRRGALPQESQQPLETARPQRTERPQFEQRESRPRPQFEPRESSPAPGRVERPTIERRESSPRPQIRQEAPSRPEVRQQAPARPEYRQQQAPSRPEFRQAPPSRPEPSRAPQSSRGSEAARPQRR